MRPRTKADVKLEHSRSEADVNEVLAANRAAVTDLVAAAEGSAATWTTPRAPGTWSPSQVVEHVPRGMKEGANIVSGAP
ncbi:hypothetical protein LuPra_01826 [Luteitalea pratensis]|uniref:DinB-like domain-containing protein n=1 Tax=Luteitalea pratensis TaxID=1855912 RepID=A0A143PJ59_LUTPR|nr:hypothetical protein LuPra_01826 [Luteitalea pratensis]